MMDNLRQLLQRARNGNAVLFCGAGMTADCLNFDDDSTLGVTFHLLRLLNEELKANGKQSNFKDIKNAAKCFRVNIGNTRLMQLLKDRFRLNRVSASIVDIAAYPWSAIYTTNYDNGLELALQSAGKKFDSINNMSDPNATESGTPIIHLHGCAEDWNNENFEQSCVLDADSYFRLSSVKNWLARLRFDIERAEIVVFAGFSAADFHLAQVFFNTSGLREKAFFINRSAANLDPDERANQEDFGEPLYIGREEFAHVVTETLKQQIPLEPRVASFQRYLSTKPSSSTPPTQDVEDLLIWGKVVPEHVKRDVDLSKSDYHVVRDEVQRIETHLGKNGGVVFLNGDICDGKSVVILGTVCLLAGRRPVFELQHAYTDILDETSGILAAYPAIITLT